MKITALILICASLALGGVRLLADNVRSDLTGQVTETDGTPIAKATVLIYTAGPKQGTSVLCPSCYADCQKKAQTDADGHFKIESLDASLLFRLLVVAANHESKFVAHVDPSSGGQKISLQPLSEEALKSKLRIKGMVMGENGKPVPEAVISPEGVGMGEMTRWGANDDEVEPLAIADDAGRFVLFCKSNNVDSVYCTAEGRGVAQQWVTFKPGGDYLVNLPDGVSVTGQVVRDGQPLAGVAIGAATKDRACGSYFNCDAVSTDSHGRFLLLNVPPGREFILYSTMNSLRGQGALPGTALTTGGSGTVQDLGKLAVQPAFTVAGQIVLSDGKPLPPDVRLFLGRSDVLDSLEAKLDADGRFEFKGVPTGSVSLALRVKDYRLSKKNPSLDWLNGQILGRVTADTKDLTILLEPGDWQNNSDDRPGGDDDYPVNQPLRSVKL